MFFEFGYKSHPFTRNIYITAKEVLVRAKEIGIDVYCSVYGYPDHKLTKNGPLWGSSYFDLDCEAT